MSAGATSSDLQPTGAPGSAAPGEVLPTGAAPTGAAPTGAVPTGAATRAPGVEVDPDGTPDGGFTRVTVAAPGLRIDLALPGDAPVAELLGPVLDLAGITAPPAGRPAARWQLHRVGRGALDPAGTLAGQLVLDGDVLHLVRARSAPAAPVFDDVVDVLATDEADGAPGRTWSPGATRTAWSALATVAAVLAAVQLGRSAPPWPRPGLLAGAADLVLLAAAGGLARVRGRVAAGRTAGLAAAVFGLVAGAALVGGAAPLGAPRLAGGAGLVGAAGPAGPGLLGALAVGTASALATVALTGHLGGTEAGVVATGLALVATLVVALLTGAPPDQVAAGVLALAVLVAAVAPGMAAAAGRLPMPYVPAAVTDLRPEDETFDARLVAGRARTSRSVLSGLLGACVALAAVGTAGVSATLPLPGAGPVTLPDRLLATAAVAALLLRARLYPATRHRAVVLAAGTVAAIAATLPAVSRPGPHGTLLLGTLLVVAAGAVAGAAVLPDRRIAPTWSRAADTLEVLATLAVVPLAVWSAGLVGFVRGIPG